MQTIYSSQDFYLAAFLVTLGNRLISHCENNGSTVFNFNEDEKLKSSVEAYFSMNASVEPMAYGNAIRSLKTVVHSYRSDKHSNSEERNYVKQFRSNK